MAAELLHDGKLAFAYHAPPVSPGPSPSPPPLVDEYDHNQHQHHHHSNQSSAPAVSASQEFYGSADTDTADGDADADVSGAGQLLLMKSEAASSDAGCSDAYEDDVGGDEDGDEDGDGEIGLPSRRHHRHQFPGLLQLHQHPHHQLLMQPMAGVDAPPAVVRTRRRKAGLPEDERVCVVCSEPASGYNFDRLTCESCKAFFRRNALKSREKIKPCSRGGDCDVSGSQRKHCPTCRLHKCLQVGMKKELILPPEKLEQRAKPKRRLAAAPPSHSGLGGRSRVGGIQHDTRRRPSAVYLDHLLSTYQQPPAGAAVPGTPGGGARQPPPPVRTVGELARAWSNATLAGRSWSADLTKTDHDCLASLREAHARLRDALLLPDEAAGGSCLKDGVGRLEQAFNQMEACIRRIISVVKLIPIFSDADKDAQILMLKVNIYGLVIMYSSFFFNPATGSWEVPMASQHAANGRHDGGSCGGGGGGVSLMQELAAAVAAIVGMRPDVSDLTLVDLDQYCANSHNVYAQLELHSRHDDLVKMLMLALKLFNSDSMPAGAARDSVERAQSVYSLLLKKYLAYRFGVPDAMQLYPSLLLSFIDMRTVENKMGEFTKLLSVESLNPLVREFTHFG